MREKQAAASVEVDVAEKQAPAKQKNDERRRQPRYSVILWDDDDHTYEYVMQMMTELFAMNDEQAFAIASEVDTTGRSVCLTTTLEHAELKRDQIHAYGRDLMLERCTGAMWATLEAVE